jgi:hypothetical protein
MSLERQFLLAACGLALLGAAALGASGEIGRGYLGFSLAGIAWAAVSGWRGRFLGLDSRLANAASLGAAAVLLLPTWWEGAAPIQGLAEFLLVLGTLRVLGAKSGRDWLQVYALSFFELVAASALTVEPAFAAIFVAYLGLAPWALVLLFLRSELEAAGRTGPTALGTGALFRDVAGVTAMLFAGTIAVFVLFPRIGAGMFAGPFGSGKAIGGFSEEVGLGDVTSLKADTAVALRASVDPPEAIDGRSLYWRGVALDAFDGRRWSRPRSDSAPLARLHPGAFAVGGSRTPGKLVRLEVLLEPTDSPAVLFLGRPLEIRGRFAAAAIDPLGNLRAVVPAGARVRYEVLSSFSPRRDPPTGRSQLLAGIDPRIVETARSIAAGARSDEERAAALVEFFRRGFAYSTEPGDPGERDPLEWFVFESRRGHCEYFASALAAMLRAVGIPSVVVNGYHGGEWNPYGGYYVVRQSDAHSWVEAYIDGAWRILDATPPAGRASWKTQAGGLAALLDAYRVRWYRWVVNYDLADQVELALRVRASSRSLGTAEFWQDSWARLRQRGPSASKLALGLAGAALVSLGVLVARAAWRDRFSDGRRVDWATARYLALLRQLERQGLVKRPGETPDEFLARIEDRLGEARPWVARLTAAYQQARFSGSGSPELRAEIDSLLLAVGRGLR